MRKEALFAIFFGIVLGLIITYGIYQARSSLFQPQNTNNSVLLPSPTPQPGDTGKLVLHSPEDGIVITEPTVTVAGTTVPSSYVVILVGNAETITSSDESGNFSVAVALKDDSNSIAAYTLEEDGTIVVVERTVIVSSVSFDEPVPTQAATSSAKVTPSPTTKPTVTAKPTVTNKPTAKPTVKATPTKQP